jgi:hypothetical protein
LVNALPVGVSVDAAKQPHPDATKSAHANAERHLTGFMIIAYFNHFDYLQLPPQRGVVVIYQTRYAITNSANSK